MEEIKISVLLDNNLIQANGLSRYTFIPSGRPYLMYTLNEKSIQNGEALNKVYVSEEGDKTTQFQPINQDEWVNLKNIMGQLGETNAQIPNNIQLSQLNSTQYVVGPYKKIAINDNVMSNILANQLANQPKEEQIARPSGNTQFFDPSLNVSAMEENEPKPTEVPNAFGMSAPVPEEAAPMALVQDQAQPIAQTADVQQPVAPAQTTIVQETQPAQMELVQPIVNTIEAAQPIEMPQAAAPATQAQPADASAQTVEMPQPIEMPAPVAQTPVETAQAVEMPQAAAPVVETTLQAAQPVDDITIVKQALQTVLNYCNGDMNKLNQLLNEHGLTVVVQNMSDSQTQTQVDETQEEFPEPVTSVSEMSIDNLPVVAQDAPAEDNVLAEESFEPSAPTLPIDNMEAQSVVNSLPDGVIPGGLPEVAQAAPAADVQQTVAAAPAQPEVAQQTSEVATTESVVDQSAPAPVDASVVSMDNIIPFVADAPNASPVDPTAIASVAPIVSTEPVANPVTGETVATGENVAQESMPTGTPTQSYEVPTTLAPVQLVQTAETAPAANVTQTEIVQPGQVSQAAPVAVDAVQNTEVSIAVPGETTPIANPADPTTMGMPSITPVTQEDMTPPPAPEELLNTSQDVVDTSFLDAGPVVVPIGQEDTASQGLPGDSGAKVLERAA